MRIPATAMTNHLMWTRSGVVWATWRLQGLAYGFGTQDMKAIVRGHHQALFQGLKGEALLLGLCAELDPVSIVEKMLDGVNIAEHPEWADEVARTLDSLEQVPLGTRAYWLSVPLAAGSIKNRALSAFRAADTQLRDTLAMPRQLPSKAEIDAALRAALDIEERIPSVFKPARATAAEQVWIALHSQHRGLAVDATAPVPASQTTPANFGAKPLQLSDFQLPTAMPNPWIDEGGQSDLGKGSPQLLNPFRRRYLKVQSPHSDAPSYQVIQALVAAPRSGWAVPGVEWISHVEQFNIDVDWALRMTVSPAEDVKRHNKRAEESLKDQYEQQEGTNTITGGGSDLAEVAENLAAFHAALNRSDKEVEVQATILFAVGADTPELAKQKAQFIADDYKRSEFLLEAPLGGQEDLWWAMQPGISTGRIARELTQITTGRDFASAVPMVVTELGDEKGARFGENITTGRRTPILRDLYGNIEADASGSFGVVAELGAGKSVLLKCEAGDTIDRGGRLVAIDRTESREYATFAKSLVADKTTIVDLLNPSYSLDPLRVFGPRLGARMVQSLFAVMLGVKARDSRGVALSRLLEPEYVAAHNITSLGRLLAHLRDLSRTAEVDELLGLIGLIASKDLGEVLFSDGMPALELNSTGIVFLTHGLSLPDRTELENAHLFDEMPLEKIYGRAMYTLLTAIAREVCFDRSQLALFLVDETHHVTASPEGERELKIFLRDGRKHAAAAGLGSHDPADFGDVETRGLIKTRFVMRQGDAILARRALDWLGLDADDDTNLHEVMHNLSPFGPDGKVAPDRRGEGLMRDVRGRIGKFHKTLPERPDRRAAVLSTPSKADPTDEPERKLTVVK